MYISTWVIKYFLVNVYVYIHLQENIYLPHALIYIYKVIVYYPCTYILYKEIGGYPCTYIYL